jgi:hypothetical protein
MSDIAFVKGTLAMLREIMEGGLPGQGTGVIDRTQADGSGNHGLLATLEGLTAAQASKPTALGLSAAAHATHAAFYYEHALRYARGEREKADWPGSFEPRTVNDEQWRECIGRLRAGYDALAAYAHGRITWSVEDAVGLAAALAHAAYHLGAVRQVAKLAVAG